MPIYARSLQKEGRESNPCPPKDVSDNQNVLVANRVEGAARTRLWSRASSSLGGQHAGLIDTEFARSSRGHARECLWGSAGHERRVRSTANVKEVTALSGRRT